MNKVYDDSDPRARSFLRTSFIQYKLNTNSILHFFPLRWDLVFPLARSSGDSQAIFGDGGVCILPSVNIALQLTVVVLDTRLTLHC